MEHPDLDPNDPFAPFHPRNAPIVRQPVPQLDDDPDGFFLLFATDISLRNTYQMMQGNTDAMARLEVRTDRVSWTPEARVGPEEVAFDLVDLVTARFRTNPVGAQGNKRGTFELEVRGVPRTIVLGPVHWSRKGAFTESTEQLYEWCAQAMMARALRARGEPIRIETIVQNEELPAQRAIRPFVPKPIRIVSETHDSTVVRMTAFPNDGLLGLAVTLVVSSLTAASCGGLAALLSPDLLLGGAACGAPVALAGAVAVFAKYRRDFTITIRPTGLDIERYVTRTVPWSRVLWVEIPFVPGTQIADFRRQPVVLVLDDGERVEIPFAVAGSSGSYATDEHLKWLVEQVEARIDSTRSGGRSDVPKDLLALGKKP